MKYLENYPELEHLSKALTFDTPECRVFAKFEVYSCKDISSDKKLLKQIEFNHSQDLLNASNSPPEVLSYLSQSPFGSLLQRSSRKMFCMLISTLNAAFPDHDFSSARPEQFIKESCPSTIFNNLSSTLFQMRSTSGSPRSYVSHLASSEPTSSTPSTTTTTPLTHPILRRMLDNVIDIDDCDVYTYSPDLNSNPYTAIVEDEDSYSSAEDQQYDSFSNNGSLSHTTTTTNTRIFRDDNDSFSFSFDEELNSPDFEMDQTNTNSAPGSINGDESEGLLWSRFVFAYNKKAKRILFVSIWGRKTAAYQSSSSSSIHPVILGNTFSSSLQFPTTNPYRKSIRSKANSRLGRAKSLSSVKFQTSNRRRAKILH